MNCANDLYAGTSEDIQEKMKSKLLNDFEIKIDQQIQALRSNLFIINIKSKNYQLANISV